MRELAADALRGSYVPLVTPFRDGEVDLERYAALVEFQCREGSHGIVVTGTTGEPSVLSVAERVALVQTAVRAAAGRIGVIAATGSQSLAETLQLSEAATQAGVDALLVVTPYYVRPPQRGLIEYFERVCGETSLPVLIYHIPGRAAVTMSVDSIAEVVRRCENLVGMKHAVNDLGYATTILARLGPRFRLFVGLEDLSYPMLAIGACGLMNAVGNLAPREVAELCEAVRADRHDRARELHYRLAELNDAVFWDTNPIPVKYLMWRRGLLERDEHRLPMSPPEPALAARLDDLLARSAVLGARVP